MSAAIEGLSDENGAYDRGRHEEVHVQLQGAHRAQAGAREVPRAHKRANREEEAGEIKSDGEPACLVRRPRQPSGHDAGSPQYARGICALGERRAPGRRASHRSASSPASPVAIRSAASSGRTCRWETAFSRPNPRQSSTVMPGIAGSASTASKISGTLKGRTLAKMSFMMISAEFHRATSSG